ncbi:MAG TPA: chorismate-binding protein, partial [Bacillales bacterium]|nr:chorismate-binding protein [Bacillales bacterium]
MTVVKQRELQQVLTQGIEQARRTSANVLVSQSMRVPSVDPLSFFACGKQDRFFWEDPDGKAVASGHGVAWRLFAEGERRFQKIEQQRNELLGNSVIDADPSVPAVGPLFLGGFSFDPVKKKTELWRSFLDADLVLPVFMLTVAGDEAWLTINCVVSPEENLEQKAKKLLVQRDRLLEDCRNFQMEQKNAPLFAVTEVLPEQWKNAVQDAAREIRDGIIDKVVLSRELQLSTEQSFSPTQVLARLRREQPNSFLFAIERNGSCFLGASPERLVKRNGNELFSSCI